MLPLVLVLVAGLALVALGDVFEFRSVRAGGGDTLTSDTAVIHTAHAPVEPKPRWQPTTSFWLFVSCTVLYLLVGAYIVLHRGGIVGDASARVAQAWYVVGSRDPHLAAIGFVWNPLPSAAAIPLVMLRGFWPALTQKAFAGSIVSALCMAGAVVQFRGLLRDVGCARWTTIAITACFALNPMVIAYGANGMSEAMYLLFLIGTVRYLLEWTVTGRLRPLVLTAINLALAFLTRYEALAAAAGVIAVVLFIGVIARDKSRSRRERLAASSADALIVGIPVITAFIAWVVVSWVITGEPFMQFTSRYGNSSIINAAGGVANTNNTGWPKIVLALAQTVAYMPLVVPLAIAAVVIAILRRDRRFLALAALAGPLGFSLMAYVGGSTFPWFRYYIPILPLALIGLALLLNPIPGMRPATPSWLRADAPIAIAVALVVGISGMASTAWAMGNSHIAPDERATLAWLFRPASSPAERQSETLLSSGTDIARRIDALGLADSSVAVDTYDCGSLIALGSDHPHQFVITSDRDFERIVADPLVFGVPYLLVPDGDQGIEAIGLVHPGIFNGGQIGTLDTKVVDEFKTPSCPTYRLIRVVSDGS